jgi:hypothetical protein
MKFARISAALSSRETRIPKTFSELWTMRRMSAASSGVRGMSIMIGSERSVPAAATRRWRVVRWPIESIWLWLTP